MPDIIERTIYKLEMDESGYIQGAERATASTARLSQIQEEANKRLQNNQAALKGTTEALAKAKTNLDSYTGSNTQFRAQLARDVAQLEKQQATLTKTVDESRQAYDRATQAAQRFASASNQPTGAIGGVPTTGLPPQPGEQLSLFPTGSLVPPEINEELRLLMTQIRELKAEDFAEIFSNSSEAFEVFKNDISALEQVLVVMKDQLEETVEGEKIFNEEFKNLSVVVTEGKKIIEEFDKQTAEAARSTLGYRQQITLLHKELSVLEQAGKKETQEYKNKLVEVTRLRKAQQDQLQTIRILASETRALDFGKAAVTTATSAFQTWTSVAILAGGASEDLQRKTFQLFAAMQLITSLEQLYNQVKTVSVLRINALSAATAVYNAVVKSTTGSLRAMNIALAATTVGAVITGIVLLISKLSELRRRTKDQEIAQQQLNDLNEEVIKSTTEQVVHLELMRKKLVDLTIPQETRIRLAKVYNKEAEEGNKIDLKQINTIDLVNAAIDRQIKKIKERARARAAENVIVKEQENVFLEEQKARVQEEKNLDLRVRQTGQGVPEVIKKDPKTGKFVSEDREVTKKRIIEEAIALVPTVVEARKKLDAALKNLGVFVTTESLIPPPPPPKKGPDNIFEQEKQRLLNQLEALRVEELEGFKKINDEFALKFRIEQQRIAKLLEEKRITKPQAAELLELAANVNREELDDALNAFYGKVMEAEEKLNNDLQDLRAKNQLESINLIEDEFNRRAELINFNEQKETQDIIEGQNERLDALKEEKKKGLIDEQDYQNAVAEIISQSEIAKTNVALRAARERQQLALNIFNESIGNFEENLATSNLIANKEALQEIQALVAQFQSGGIKSYEEYKKRLAAIQKKYEDAELQRTIDTLQKQLDELRLRAQFRFNLTEDQYKELLKLIEQKERELVAAQTRQTTATGAATGGDEKKKVDTIADYANAIGQLTESIVSFWQKANEAEAAALDRSIALQERRVEEARRIAERGNASYVKMEEDRLKQLQIARENAARRDIAVNAAIQASQIMVGITGAISKIATPGVGIAETIASIAVIVSSLAAGFALVRTLQNNQPRFATGEKYVRRKRDEPAGVDTVHAMLTEGEAVITKEKNKAYHPVIEAIHDGTVPPDFLNRQVEKYHQVKVSPQVNYERVKDATELRIMSDGKLAAIMTDQNRKIDENNHLQRKTLEAMKRMSVSATIDKDGVAIAVNEYIQKLKIDKFV